MIRDEEMVEGERRGEEEMEMEVDADEDNEVDGGNENGDEEDAGGGRDGGASSREEWFSQPASGAVPLPLRRSAHAESSHADVKHAAVSVHNLMRLLRCRETCSHAVDPALLKYSARGSSTVLHRRLQAWSEVGGLMSAKDRRSWRAVYSKSPPPTSSRVVMQPCVLEPYPRSTIAAAFSRCGRLLASTHGDHTVKLTDFRTGECIRSLHGHMRTPWVVRFNPVRSNILVSGSLDREVRLWDAFTGECIQAFQFSRPIASVSFHAGGDIMSIATGHKLYMCDCSGIGGRHGENGNDKGMRGGRRRRHEGGTRAEEAGQVGDNTESPEPSGLAPPVMVLRTHRSLRAVQFHPTGAPYLLTAELHQIISQRELIEHLPLPLAADWDVDDWRNARTFPARSRVVASGQAGPSGFTAPVAAGGTGGVDDEGYRNARAGAAAVVAAAAVHQQQGTTLMANAIPSLVQQTDDERRNMQAESNATDEAMGNASGVEPGVPSPSAAAAAAVAAATAITSSLPTLQQQQQEPPRFTQQQDPSPTVVDVGVEGLGALVGTVASAATYAARTGTRVTVHTDNRVETATTSGQPPHQFDETQGEAVPPFVQPGGPEGESATTAAVAAMAAAAAAAAFTGALEQPCCVKLRIWPFEARKMYELLESSSPLLELPNVVLCSEMGAHFSPCGRFLVVAVVCHTPVEATSVLEDCMDEESDGSGDDFASPGEFSYELRVLSMEPATFGKVLSAKGLAAAHCLTSIQVSPTSKHVLVAYGRRHMALLESLVADRTSITPMHTIVEMYSLPNLELVDTVVSAEDEVNVATFHPIPGEGFAYGTKEGRLQRLRRL